MKILIGVFLLALCLGHAGAEIRAEKNLKVNLPPPQKEGLISVESALGQRRSVRSYGETPLALADIGQILWAAQGITSSQNRRTAPSAGALYPLELYLVSGRVSGLSSGIYRYSPRDHDLTMIAPGDVHAQLTTASWSQNWIRAAPAIVVVAAIPARTAVRYGDRTSRYVAMEVGAVVQNIQLQGVSLRIGSTFVGAFDDKPFKKILGLPGNEQVMALVPLGYLR